MNMKTYMAATAAGWMAACALAPALAGEITPPPGPVQPTNRVTINQQTIPTLPYKIISPGSYVLTSNLVGTSGDDGIIIGADNVTIDLNGFSLLGVAGSHSAIVGDGSRQNIRVVNGVIRDWGMMGVNFENDVDCSLENLSVSNVEGDGVLIGQRSRIVNCTSSFSGGRGFSVGAFSVVTGAIANQNDQEGIQTSSGSALSNCVSRANLGDGFSINTSSIENSNAYNNGVAGIRGGGGATVRGCTMSLNAGIGLSLGVAASAMDCTITSSGQEGVRALRRSKLSGVVSSNNVNGFVVDDAVTFENCSATANDVDGFKGLNGCVLINCLAEVNGDDGFEFEDNANLQNCTSLNATGDGIKLKDGASVIGCTVQGSGNEGIFVENSGVVTNSTSIENVRNGIRTFQAAKISHCVVRNNQLGGVSSSGTGLITDTLANENTGIGISGSSATTIINCKAYFNGGNGIQFGADSFILNNHADSNGGEANFRGLGSDGSRIEGNNATDGLRGFYVTGSGSFLGRNTARTNTTAYDIAAGNAVGTISASPAGAGAWNNFAF